jgi:hypothetical protein
MTDQAAPAPRAGKRRQLILLAILLVLSAVCFVGIWFATRGNATNAKVGDCMHQTGTDEIKIVKCDDPEADFKVVGRVEGKEQIESTISITSVCDQWKDQTTNTYWQGERGKKGTVLCLAKLK